MVLLAANPTYSGSVKAKGSNKSLFIVGRKSTISSTMPASVMASVSAGGQLDLQGVILTHPINVSGGDVDKGAFEVQ